MIEILYLSLVYAGRREVRHLREVNYRKNIRAGRRGWGGGQEERINKQHMGTRINWRNKVLSHLKAMTFPQYHLPSLPATDI